MIEKIVEAYKGSVDFLYALEADMYFAGDNREVMEKVIITLDSVKDENGNSKARNVKVIGNRVSSNFFSRFVVQQNQFLLGNGVQLTDDALKGKLGRAFDTALQQAGEYALIQGVCFGFWNLNHLEVIKAASDCRSGFVPLYDEDTGALMAGIQFWQIAEEKPKHYRVFELDGLTEYKQSNVRVLATDVKRGYVQKVRTDAISTQTVGENNYSTLPVIPFYGNSLMRSELSMNIKSKIDLYDRIFSDFGDNLDRTNDIYWVINNFGGTSDQIIEMLAEINRIKATYTEAGASGQSTAEPHTIEVPYLARQVALDLLEKALYKDYMALNMDEITGGSLTNVAIKIATTNLNLKADRYEWQAFTFVQRVLALLGVETEDIQFKRRVISNDSETVQDIYAMRSDITRKKALELNPYIQADEIEELLKDMDAEDASGLPSADELQAQIDEMKQPAQQPAQPTNQPETQPAQ
jgi:hypothetical protein